MGIKKEELINILKYAYLMSRVISPIEAQKVGLNGFDGAVCDFYKALVEKLQNDEEINLSEKLDDEFVNLQYECMKKDVEDQSIEYDGILIIDRK